MLNLKLAMEGFQSRLEDADDSNTTVSIDQQIEIEAGAAEEAEVVEETVDAVEEADDDATEAEELMAQFSMVFHMNNVVETTGWSRPIAMAFNSNNEIETNFGVYGLPAMENLEMIASPSDTASVMVLEGFKDTMKAFWEWVKKICRKIADAVTNLAERVTAMFMGIDRVSRRLANAIKNASISPEKMKEKKGTFMKKDDWERIHGDVKKQSGNIQATVTDAKFDSEEGSERFSSVVNSTGKEMALSETGWTAADCGSSDKVAALVASSKVFAKAYSMLKSTAKANEAAATRQESMSNTDSSEAKASREDARAKVQALTKGQKYVNHLVKVSTILCKEFVKVQRAMFQCRGKAEAKK